jgi:hypothetical protein
MRERGRLFLGLLFEDVAFPLSDTPNLFSIPGAWIYDMSIVSSNSSTLPYSTEPLSPSPNIALLVIWLRSFAAIRAVL